MGGVEIFGPGPTSEFHNELEEYFQLFNRSHPEYEDFFPIGFMDEDCWVVYRRLESGEVQCGLYDFENGGWFAGAPFSTFEEFTDSLAV